MSDPGDLGAMLVRAAERIGRIQRALVERAVSRQLAAGATITELRYQHGPNGIATRCGIMSGLDCLEVVDLSTADLLGYDIG